MSTLERRACDARLTSLVHDLQTLRPPRLVHARSRHLLEQIQALPVLHVRQMRDLRGRPEVQQQQRAWRALARTRPCGTM